LIFSHGFHEWTWIDLPQKGTKGAKGETSACRAAAMAKADPREPFSQRSTLNFQPILTTDEHGCCFKQD
jgi:hypothetical protein